MNCLTIEELKALKEGDWVWIKKNHDGGYGYYAQLDEQFSESDLIIVYSGTRIFLEYCDYQSPKCFGWTAWKNKEQYECSKDPLPLELEVQALHQTVFFQEAYIERLKEELSEAHIKIKKLSSEE